MGWINCDLSNPDAHEGWVRMLLIDGARLSGTSCGRGYYPEGYTYDPDRPGHINEEPIPFESITDWQPECVCGWTGRPMPAHGDRHEPDEWEEEALMHQWRDHIDGLDRDLFWDAPNWKTIEAKW